jgi:hypothetical protein
LSISNLAGFGSGEKAVFVAKLYDEARAADRLEADVDSTVRDAASRPHTVIVKDLSSTGCGMETQAELEVGASILIGLPGIGVRAARVVRRDGHFYGCAFDVPVSRRAIRSAVLGSVVNASSELPVEAVAGPGTLSEPHIRKLPTEMRIGVIIGATALLWAAIIGGRMLLAR